MKPAKSIARIELEARALGLSYGEYLAGRTPRRLPEGTEEPRELPPIGENTQRDKELSALFGEKPTLDISHYLRAC